jgi:hypothetical protein
MSIFFVILIVSLAVLIAFLIVGRESRTHEKAATPIVFDIDGAVAWIADQLPTELQSILSYEEVRSIVEWNIEFMKSRGVIANGHKPVSTGPVVVGGAESAEYILKKATESGSTFTAEQVHAVLDAQVAYLEHIGAVGFRSQDDEK